jgi:VanZ family protein
MKIRDLPHQQARAEWSNRILILSLVGIAYLTLFPFRFRASAVFDLHELPFLLGNSDKHSGHLDFFLNVLLFVPFGFGFCAKLRQQGATRWTSLLLALTVGAAASYLVELLQFYIPGRDSGWEDVISNTAGSVVGVVLFELYGGKLLNELTKWEVSFDRWLSPRRTALLLVAYFALCFGTSALLQNRTRLSNWDPQCILFVGNDASGRSPWKGQILLLQIWNRALPERAIQRIAGGESAEGETAGLLGSYDFTTTPPYHDQTNVLPPLSWTSERPQFTNVREADVDAKSWLRTDAAAENLTQQIRKSNQFTVHIVCAPAAIQDAGGRIVSLSQSADNVNFHLRQEGANLVFWFRNPLSETRSVLAWTVRDAFVAGKARDIVASYDGADAFLYLDGIRVPRNYRLSPGASLMHDLSFIKTGDLEGYVIVYETLVFFPAGLLIGVAARKTSGQKIFEASMLFLGLILPAVLLEVLLAAVSGRRIWAGNVGLCLAFGLAGILLINADRRITNARGPTS